MQLLRSPVVLVVVLVVFVLMRRGNRDANEATGHGRVVGIFGLMGSGKSYFAVRMALRRVLAGATVYANFTLNEDGLAEYVSWYNGRRRRRVLRVLTLGVAGAPISAKGAMHSVNGAAIWSALADLSDAVVIIDEAHLVAPAGTTTVLPMAARWKMSMARKFNLDVYYVSQHESNVNVALRRLTNIMYVCNAWFGSFWFTAKGWAPHDMRKQGKHLDRKGYRFSKRVAALYDTHETMAIDEHFADESSGRAMAAREAYNGRRRRAAVRTESEGT